MNLKPELPDGNCEMPAITFATRKENETSKGRLTGVKTDIEINLRLTPEQKFELDENQKQQIRFDLQCISQRLIDFMDRFLGHYINGGTVSGFEE